MTDKLGAQDCCSAWAPGLGSGPQGHQQVGCLGPSCTATMERVGSGGLAVPGPGPSLPCTSRMGAPCSPGPVPGFRGWQSWGSGPQLH